MISLRHCCKRNGWRGGRRVVMRWCTPAIVPLALQVAFVGVAFSVQPSERVDPAQWTTQKSVTANFAPALWNATVSLLASRQPTSKDAFESIYTANVIVSIGSKVIYEFSRKPLVSQWNPSIGQRANTYYLDDVLELIDLTGDGVPEIVFHTGWTAADNYFEALHVLHFVGLRAGRAVFQDIRTPDFEESEWDRVAWLTYAGHRLIIAAQAEEPPEAKEPGEWCEQCGRYHRYRVYEWDNSRRRMTLRVTIPPTHKLQGEADFFQEDRTYILEHLQRLYGNRSPRHASTEAERWLLHTDFDPDQWETVKTQTANFGPTLPAAIVQLLVSKEPITHDPNPGGSDSKYRMVNVVVRAGEHIIYQYCWLPLAYHAGRAAEDFFHDANLELRDVTNDGIPEILFHSGIWSADLHVLHYDPGPTAVEPFRDVALPAWELGFTWFDVAGRTVAIVSTAEMKDPNCWTCPRGHHYEVYEWTSPQQAFTLRHTVPSPGQLQNVGTDPFAVDAGYLRADLTRRHSPTPSP